MSKLNFAWYHFKQALRSTTVKKMRNTKTKIFLPLIILLTVFISGRAYAADVYVDANGPNTEEDGSEANPYHSIGAALSRVSSNPENNRQVFVRAGNYKEEIVLPDKAVLTGQSKESVTIDRENLEGTVVTMGKDSTIESITVKGGNYAVVAPAYNKSTIRDCLIEKSKRIGVWIKRSNNLLTSGVDMWDSTISNNIRKGVYGETRFIYFVNNRFSGNGEEGIDLRSKVKGTITGNAINNNGEGGIELEIRKAAIEISNNSLLQNGSNGITLNNRTYVGGKVIIENNANQNNYHYGIRCAGTKKWTKKLWRKSIKNGKNTMTGNIKGNISASCKSK